MEENHPEYREVVFHDLSSNERFLVGSTAETDKTTEIDGKEFPLIEVEVSSESHPFYTGEQRLVDTEGQVEKFRKKYRPTEEDQDEDEKENSE